MPADAKSKEHGSDTMSHNEPKKREKAAEPEYLRQQADDARLAISRTIDEMRETLKEAGDVQAWARKYPWPSIGLAAALGFVVARAVTPSRNGHKDENLLQRVLADEEISARLKELAEADHAKRGGMINSMLASLGQNLGHSLQTALVAALTGKAAASAGEDHEQPEPSDATTSASL